MITTKKDSRKKIVFVITTPREKIKLPSILSELKLSPTEFYVYTSLISGNLKLISFLTEPDRKKYVEALTVLGTPFELLGGAPLIYIEVKPENNVHIKVPSVWRINSNVMNPIKNKSRKK